MCHYSNCKKNNVDDDEFKKQFLYIVLSVSILGVLDEIHNRSKSQEMEVAQ